MASLKALLEAEVEERQKNVVAQRLKEAHFPKIKTLEERDFETASHLPAPRLRKPPSYWFIASHPGTNTFLQSAFGRARRLGWDHANQS
jgi:DNA replication protein DnaC